MQVQRELASGIFDGPLEAVPRESILRALATEGVAVIRNACAAFPVRPLWEMSRKKGVKQHQLRETVGNGKSCASGSQISGEANQVLVARPSTVNCARASLYY